MGKDQKIRGKRRRSFHELPVTTRQFKVLDFGWVWARVRVLVRGQVFIVEQVIEAQPLADAKITEIKRRSWMVVQNDENEELGCKPGEPQSWLFQHFVDGYEAMRMAENVNRWARDYRLPSHALWSTLLGVLYGHVVVMRADNPQSIARVHAEATALAARMDSEHPLVTEARERVLKVGRATKVNFPREYARTWSARWLVDVHWQPHLNRVIQRYVTLRDAIMAYMGEIALRLEEAHDALVQIAAADEVATPERPERLRELIEDLRPYQGVSPFHRVLWHLVGDADTPGDLGRAVGFCERGMGEEARALLQRAVRSLAFVLARFRAELQHQKVSAILGIGGSLIPVERAMLAAVLGQVRDTFEVTTDRDFEKRIRDNALPHLRDAAAAATVYEQPGDVVHLEQIRDALTAGFRNV